MLGPRTKGFPIILTLLGLISILAVACGGSQETNPEKLVPEGSNLIAQVNLIALLSANGILPLITAGTPDQENELSIDNILEEALSETGVDIRQFSQAVIFVDTVRNEEFAGIIAKGSFNELAIISSIRSAAEGKMVSSPYKEELIYVVGDNTDAPSLSVLKDGLLILGTDEAVRAVIDVQQGDRKKVSGDLVEAFTDLGLGIFRLEAAVPTEMFAEVLGGDSPDLSNIPFLGGALAGEGALGLFGAVEAFRDLEFAGLILSQNGQIFILRANLEFSSEESAESISGLLGGLITLGASFSPSPELTELLARFEVSQTGAQVSIRLEMNGPEITELISNLTAITQTETTSGQERAPRERGIVVPQKKESPSGDEAHEGAPPSPQIVGLGEEFPEMPTSFHVQVGEAVTYSTAPPSSGNHWERWANCGFYPEGLPDEIITHNLEHGNIVISYNLPSEGHAARLQAVIDNLLLSGNWGVVRSYEGIPEGQIVLSAWGRMFRMGAIDQESIEAFFALYAGELGPERIPC